MLIHNCKPEKYPSQLNLIPNLYVNWLFRVIQLLIVKIVKMDFRLKIFRNSTFGSYKNSCKLKVPIQHEAQIITTLQVSPQASKNIALIHSEDSSSSNSTYTINQTDINEDFLVSISDTCDE